MNQIHSLVRVIHSAPIKQNARLAIQSPYLMLRVLSAQPRLIGTFKIFVAFLVLPKPLINLRHRREDFCHARAVVQKGDGLHGAGHVAQRLLKIANAHVVQAQRRKREGKVFKLPKRVDEFKAVFFVPLRNAMQRNQPCYKSSHAVRTCHLC